MLASGAAGSRCDVISKLPLSPPLMAAFPWEKFVSTPSLQRGGKGDAWQLWSSCQLSNPPGPPRVLSLTVYCLWSALSSLPP